MGVKDLWSVLSPYCDRKPLCELRGKTVAIDLAGWVCEGLNVVDYFIHPRHYLKNLFFRTCCLIYEEVTPVFVLEGSAPLLKNDVMTKRNEIQFRGVRPKTQKKSNEGENAGSDQQPKKNSQNGRQRFNQVLKQCEKLLKSMGINCIQAPGEAEAFCAFLNKNGLVDGVISQDSDCFAYGAIRVYRNFSISNQGAQAAQGGAVDIYDMEKIQQSLDFGQRKVIAMALLCGCDYCPAGVDGIGRDGVLKLFQKYKDSDILERLRSWRKDADKFKTLELRVEDKNVCANCGHIGSTRSHSNSGCGICRTNRSCNDALWKQERLIIKSELAVRKKALMDPTFPSEDIIQEFLSEPVNVPQMNLTWMQPNVVAFVKHICPLLQWTELYSFRKIFPIFTRWQVCNDARRQNTSQNQNFILSPAKLVKRRTVKGIASIQILWSDHKGLFDGLIPDEQLQEQASDQNSKDFSELFTTAEPLFLVEAAYPTLLEEFYMQTTKPKRVQTKKNKKSPLSALDNFDDLMTSTNEIAAEAEKKNSKKKKQSATKNMQLIEKFFKPKNDKPNTPRMVKANFPICNPFMMQCSTPTTKCLPFELDSDYENDSINVSDVINDIVERPKQREVLTYTGRILQYQTRCEFSANKSKDDLDLFRTEQQNRLLTNLHSKKSSTRNFSLDDSFDVLVKMPKFG